MALLKNMMLDTATQKLVDAVGKNDPIMAAIAFSEGADANIKLYGPILDHTVSDDMMGLFIENGYRVSPENFSSPVDLLLFGLRMGVQDLNFWKGSVERFFPDGFMPGYKKRKNPKIDQSVVVFDTDETDQTIMMISKYMANFKDNTQKIRRLSFEFFNFDLVTEYYRKKYGFSVDDPYYEYLVKWDVYNETNFAQRSVDHAVTKYYRHWEKEIWYMMNSVKIKKENQEIRFIKSEIRVRIAKLKDAIFELWKIESVYLRAMLFEHIAEDMFMLRQDIENLRGDALTESMALTGKLVDEIY